MKVRTLDTAEDVAKAAADILSTSSHAQSDLILGLPTGLTAIPFYDELARRHERRSIDLSRARAFNLDELLVPGDHPASFRTFMTRHAWVRTGLDPARCDIPDTAADPHDECRRYDEALAAAGGLDLACLGLGTDGHIGYNLPGAPHDRTHIVELPAELADSLGVANEWRPLRAITMGLGPLLEARRVLVMATGATKSQAVRALVEGPVSERWPCSLLRDHPALDVIVDRSAR